MWRVEPLIRVEIRPLGLHILINGRKPEPGQDGDILRDRTHLLLLTPPLSSSLSCLVCCWFILLIQADKARFKWLDCSSHLFVNQVELLLDDKRGSSASSDLLTMLENIWKCWKKIFEDIWPACMHRVGQTLPCKCAYCWSDYKPPCWRGVGLIKLKLRPEVWQASLKNKVKPSYFNTWGPIVLFVDYFWSIVIVFAREWRVHSAWALQQLLKVNKIWDETIQGLNPRSEDW